MSGRLAGEQSDTDDDTRRYSEDERTNTLHAPSIRRWQAKQWTEEPLFNVCSTRGGMTFLLALINFTTMLSRCSLAILLVPMGEELRWPPFSSEKGWVFGSFFAGYMTLQYPSASIIQLFGLKSAMGFCLLAAAVSSCLAPIVLDPKGGIEAICGCIFILGMVQAPVMTCVSDMLLVWVAPHERPMASGICSIGAIMGNVAAALGTPLLAVISWRVSFYLFGFLYLVLTLMWLIFAASSPARSFWTSPAERTYLSLHIPVKVESKRLCRAMPLSLLCTCGAMAVVQAHICLNYVFYLLMVWLPTYLHAAHRLPLEEVGLYLAAPWVMLPVAQVLTTTLGDTVVASEALTPMWARRMFQLSSFLGAAALLVVLSALRNGIFVMLTLILLYGFFGIAQGGYGCHYVSVAREHLPVMMSIGNTLATIPGVIGPVMSASTLEKDSGWAMLLRSSAAVLCISAAIFAVCSSMPEAGQQRIMPELDENITEEVDREEEGEIEFAQARRQVLGFNDE